MSNFKSTEFEYRDITIHFSNRVAFFEGPITSIQDNENGCIAFNCPDLIDSSRLRRIVLHPREFLYMERGPVIEELKR